MELEEFEKRVIDLFQLMQGTISLIYDDNVKLYREVKRLRHRVVALEGAKNENSSV